jgi:hypothetical protein
MWFAALLIVLCAVPATVSQRVALYANGDPADDPPLIGTGTGEACATCHHKH